MHFFAAVPPLPHTTSFLPFFQNPFFPFFPFNMDAFMAANSFEEQKIEGDGNCFYRSIAAAILGDDDQHAEIRKVAMDYLSAKIDEYSIYFESKNKFKRSVAANRRSGVWNTEICDLVPGATAEALKIKLTVHSWTCGKVVSETYAPEGAGCELNLLLVCGHYSLLVPAAAAAMPAHSAPPACGPAMCTA